MNDLALVFVGGGCGAACRWLVSKASSRLLGSSFPWGTLIVNLGGCFLIGLALGLAEHGLGGRRLKPLAVAGFLGGLTTFSSYAYETMDMLRRGAWGKAIGNVALDNLGGLALAAFGLAFGLYLGEGAGK
jgi:fluoride exporter